MANFTVAMTSTDSTTTARGQSFTPNVPGPNGSGGPGSATEVYLSTFTVGYDSDTSSRQEIAYLYDYVPTTAQLSAGVNALLTCSGYTDGSDFGSGSYTRTFTFTHTNVLDPTKTYYLLFPGNQNLQYTTTSQYSGGKRYNSLISPQSGSDLQFSASFETV